MASEALIPMTIMSTAVNDDVPRLLGPDMFAFEFDAELRRAVRLRTQLTLVVVEAVGDREATPLPVTEMYSTPPLGQIAKLVGTRIRETDLLGQTAAGALSLVLVDADYEHSTHVINRLVSRIEREAFGQPVKIQFGAACYPSHALDAASLTREALSRRVANCHGGIEPAPADSPSY